MFNKFSKGELTLTITGLILVLIAFVIIEGWIVACLWNWLMPTIFGLTTITPWQGMGILILCNTLFNPISYDSSKKS